jgi:hypothetical protein
MIRLVTLLVSGVTLLGVAVWSEARAQGRNKMWYVGIDACTTSGPEKCIKGILEKDSPKFVSKLECERGAQQIVRGLQETGLRVNRVWCEELAR